MVAITQARVKGLDMAWRKASQSLIDAFDAALPRRALVVRRKMFGYPAAFVNGNLFAGLHQEDVLVRLSPEKRVELLGQGGRLWEPTPGRTLREYVLLPVKCDESTRVRWIRQAFEYAAKLPVRQGKEKMRSGENAPRQKTRTTKKGKNRQ